LEQYKNNVSDAIYEMSRRIYSEIYFNKWDGVSTEINLENFGLDENNQTQIFQYINSRYPDEFELVDGVIKSKVS
jgi:hypothetical protein